VNAEFLKDDLGGIRALLPDPDGLRPEALAGLLMHALDLFASDETTLLALEREHHLAAETAKQEIVRKQSAALATSQRAQVIRQEMQVHELRERIQALQETHHQTRAQIDLLRQSAALLRRQIAQLERRVRSSPAVPGWGPAALRTVTTWLRGRRHG